jgi:hypothetical protein
MLLAAIGVLGCAERAESTAPFAGQLREGVVARVGSEEVLSATVARVVQAQQVGARVACESAVRDALLAVGAREQLGGYGLVTSAERSALARTLLEQIQSEAQARPVADDELAAATLRNWKQVDRPPSARTTHAVVMVEQPDQDAAARALAERIAVVVADETQPEGFMQRVKAVPAGSLKVKTERLPPVAADGRVVDLETPSDRAGPRFDPAFAQAANAIAEVGGHSPVTKSAYGYHVILLEARLEEQRLAVAERRKRLSGEIVDRRALRRVGELVEQLKQQHSVELARAAIDLTGRVRVQQ